MKFLIWFIIILGGLTVARMLNARQERRDAPKPTGNGGNMGRSPSNNTAEPMVRCARCGIYMPRSESLLIGKQTWCSEEHARLGANPGQPS